MHFNDSSCASSSDNGHPPVVLVGSWDNAIYCYNSLYGKVTQTLRGHDDAVSAVCLAGRGNSQSQMLWSSSWDATVKLWQCESSRINPVPVAEFVEHEAEIKALDATPSGQLAVSGAADGM